MPLLRAFSPVMQIDMLADKKEIAFFDGIN